jgi:hypothetical protein
MDSVGEELFAGDELKQKQKRESQIQARWRNRI